MFVSGRNLEVGQAILILGGPVSNLVLASGAISAMLLLLRADVKLIGTAVFFLYFVGLGVIYAIMHPVLDLLGARRVFQATLVLVGVAFFLFLAVYLL
jgi:hypothetical protein